MVRESGKGQLNEILAGIDRSLREIDSKLTLLVKSQSPRPSPSGSSPEIALDIETLLSLPDHLRKSAMTLSEFGEEKEGSRCLLCSWGVSCHGNGYSGSLLQRRIRKDTDLGKPRRPAVQDGKEGMPSRLRLPRAQPPHPPQNEAKALAKRLPQG